MTEQCNGTACSNEACGVAGSATAAGEAGAAGEAPSAATLDADLGASREGSRTGECHARERPNGRDRLLQENWCAVVIESVKHP